MTKLLLLYTRVYTTSLNTAVYVGCNLRFRVKMWLHIVVIDVTTEHFTVNIILDSSGDAGVQCAVQDYAAGRNETQVNNHSCNS